MASVNLSVIFDLVSVKLLFKNAMDYGFGEGSCKTCELWLTERKLYVESYEMSLCIHDSDDDTVQGSVLGPLICAIFAVIYFKSSFFQPFDNLL